jgi:hypothetical protein
VIDITYVKLIVTGVTSEELGIISSLCNSQWATRAQGNVFICREEGLSVARMQAICGYFNPERKSYGYKALSVEMYRVIKKSVCTWWL